MLNCVTLTGADDTVDPGELAELSKEFPYVEWGILIGSREGVHRMPSKPWISELIRQKINSEHDVNLALHVCGKRLRMIAAGEPDLIQIYGEDLFSFNRVQLNWHGEQQDLNVAQNVVDSFVAIGGDSKWFMWLIFQLDGVNDLMLKTAIGKLRVDGLFDKSHGAGILPDSWPEPHSDCFSGYAGGLGPDNVLEEYQKIAAVVKDKLCWIDMETKLFDGPQFSLKKCRSVLEQMKPFVSMP